MKKRDRLRFALLVWFDWIRDHPSFVGSCLLLCVIILGVLAITTFENFVAHPRESARLLLQRVQHEEDGNRWFWMIETQSRQVLSVRKPMVIPFEAGKTVCIQRRTGRIFGLQRVKILHDGACQEK